MKYHAEAVAPRRALRHARRMPKSIECFFLEPTASTQLEVRRYGHHGDECKASGVGYHDARAVIGTIPHTDECPDPVPHDHPEWPKACACGYVFTEDDEWQTRAPRIYKRSDSGALLTLDDAPPGAMWFAPWYPDTYRGPDGQTLVVRTPGGDWVVDARSNGAKVWTREGTPPKVTAHPSIGIGRGAGGAWDYHGWLRDGRLIEC